MASSPFKRPGGALMWPCSTLKKSSWNQKKKLAGVSVNVYGAAEAPEEQAGK